MRDTDRRIIKKAALSSLTLALFLLTAGLGLPGPSFSEPFKDLEEKAVIQAARDFLDAEMRRDYEAVYGCFAPSSPYVRTHSFEEYLKEAAASEDIVVDYAIVEVTFIQENKDLEAWPSVEKFAQVEVDVVFLHVSTKRTSEINIGFIFLKEGGRWYKS
ncbi:MAG: hypothetical protein PHU03_08405 [Syntrophales bacterium]|nr:hypothetical protein [Syntrophales bacterium]